MAQLIKVLPWGEQIHFERKLKSDKGDKLWVRKGYTSENNPFVEISRFGEHETFGQYSQKVKLSPKEWEKVKFWLDKEDK